MPIQASDVKYAFRRLSPRRRAAVGELRLLPEHRGAEYGWVIERLHRHLQPRTYFEIGTLRGRTLRLAKCASIAVDPSFHVRQDVIGEKPSCWFFQLRSDDFFAAHDLRKLFGAGVDLAFLDGMHHYEFLLRDFMNTERSCARNSVILLHDCLPTDKHVARRDGSDLSLAGSSMRPGWWAGDVWKAAAIIRRHRPDLRIVGITAPPTGLIAITDLDPGSGVLASAYDEAVRAFAGELAPASGVAELARSIPMLAPRDFASAEGVRRALGRT